VSLAEQIAYTVMPEVVVICTHQEVLPGLPSPEPLLG
jgi:hypothetical protein